MPDRKISELTDLAAAAEPTDELVVYDPNAGTAAEKNKRVSLTNLLAYLVNRVADKCLRFTAPGSAPAISGASEAALYTDGASLLASINGAVYRALMRVGIVNTSPAIGTPAAQFQAASGESSSATVLSVKDGAGTEKTKLLADGTYTSSNNINTSQNVNVVNSFGGSNYQASIGAGANGLRMVNSWALNWVAVGAGATSVYASSVDLTLRRAAAANLAIGAVDAAAPVAQTLSVQNVVAGTSNTAGADWTRDASRGTGTGAGGKHVWRVAPAGASGLAQNALVNGMELDSLGELELPRSSGSVGIVLKSPDGTRYRLTVANGGTLSIAAA